MILNASLFEKLSYFELTCFTFHGVKLYHLVELIPTCMCMQSYQLKVYFFLIYVIAHNLFMNINEIREKTSDIQYIIKLNKTTSHT